MSPLSEDKLLSSLAEIQSDIRQIKSDLQALLTLLKQQQKATPASPLMATTWRSPLRAGGQPRLKTFFVICERREERIIRGTSHGEHMPKVWQARLRRHLRFCQVERERGAGVRHEQADCLDTNYHWI